MPVSVELATEREEISPAIIHTGPDATAKDVASLPLVHAVAPPEKGQRTWIRYQGLVAPVAIRRRSEEENPLFRGLYEGPSFPGSYELPWEYVAFIVLPGNPLLAAPFKALEWKEVRLALVSYYKGIIDAATATAPPFDLGELAAAVRRP